MKIFTFALALTILFLTVKPCMDIIYQNKNTEQGCFEGVCSLENQENKKENKKEDCSDKNCNPFQICGAFVVHNFSNPLEGFVHSEIIVEHLFHYNSTFTSQFKPDFWQPPKIV
jgi:hypothetical protein